MDEKGGIMMCKLKGRMDKGGHYEMWKKVALRMWKLKVDALKGMALSDAN